MPKNVHKAKARKNENNAKKKNRKKLLIIGICAILIIVAGSIITYSIYTGNHQEGVEIYRYHGQTVRLFADGRFTASLAHRVEKSGTYTKATESNRITVLFHTDGKTEVGRIIDNSLYIPNEWDDGHGHGNVFPRRNKVQSNSGHRH